MVSPTREEVEQLLADLRVGPPWHDPDWDCVRSLHYDPWGEPCSLRTWARLFEGAHKVPGAWELYYCVGDDEVYGSRVMTIWASGHPEGLATLYETSILTGPLARTRRWHYSTRAEAEAGHQAAVEHVKAHSAPNDGEG